MTFPNSKAFLAKEYQVNSCHSDLEGNLSLPALFSLFQEVAWEHATINNFGYEHLLKDNLFWALSRVRVEIERLPKWGEPFRLTTWAAGTDGLFALRDYQVDSKDGQKLLGATSSWLVVDMKRRRPQRLDQLKDTMPTHESTRATAMNAQRLKSPTGSNISGYSVTAKVLDIDVNNHINNTKYVEWALNSLPLELYQSINIKEVELNFLAEGFCNDSIDAKAYETGNHGYSVCITRSNNSQNLALLNIAATAKI